MKKVNLQYAGGFPFETDTLAWMQDAYRDAISAICLMFGQKVIVSGCVIANSVISNGIIFYQGEVIPFEGGAYSSTMGYVFEEENLIETYQDGSSHPAYTIKKCKLTTDTSNNFNSEFKRFDLELLLNRVEILWTYRTTT